MDVEILSTFNARINSVEFSDEKNFNSTKILLGHIESQFGEVYNDDFVSDLAQFIEDAGLEINNYASSEYEYDPRWDVYHTESFEKLRFNSNQASELNAKLESGAYNIEHNDLLDIIDGLSSFDKLGDDGLKCNPKK